MSENLSSNFLPILGKNVKNTSFTNEIEMCIDDEGNTAKLEENDNSSSFYMKKVRRYMNKLTPFFAGSDVLSEKIKKKLEERATRFGLEGIPTNNFTLDQVQDLYKSIGVSSNDNDVRLNVIHIRGVEEMSTQDIFQYFIKFGPESIEWIDDTCCNVIWLDNVGAARALLGMSKQLQLKNKNMCYSFSNEKMEEKDISNEIVVILTDDESMDEDDDNEVSYKRTKSKNPCIEMSEDDKEKNESFLIDEKGIWRLGLPYFKAKTLLLRFATTDDIKHPGAEKRSQYYTKYGNPNYNGLRGLISTSRKIKMKKKRIQKNVNVELKELVSNSSKVVQLLSKSGKY